MKLMPNNPIGKKQFLAEHNSLSPINLQATFALLTRFQEEKKPELKDADWSHKLRIPFIAWLIALTPLSQAKKSHIGRPKKQEYKTYPRES